MSRNIDQLIPSAKQIQQEAALKEAEKAEQYARLAAAVESEKRALIERLARPSGKSEDEKIELASTVIQRAVRNGLTEVQVYRFPNSLCTDRGRAINQREPGWENTLTGIPKDKAALRVAHTAAVGPADIVVNGKVLFSNVANGESLDVVVPAATYKVEIVPTGATSPVVLGPLDLPAKAGYLTRVFAVGAPSQKTMTVAVGTIKLPASGSGTPNLVNTGTGGQAAGLDQARNSAPSNESGLWVVALLAALFAAVVTVRTVAGRKVARKVARR